MNATVLAAAAVIAIAAARKTGATGKVLHRERAAGVVPELQQLLDAWEALGEWPVVVAGGEDWPYPGGLRTDATAQAAAYAGGLSGARTLRDTPHGRGAALDVWPAGFNANQDFDSQPGMRELMVAFGEFAERRALAWGGRFLKPDYPHVEVSGWQALPYPPPDYGGVA